MIGPSDQAGALLDTRAGTIRRQTYGLARVALAAGAWTLHQSAVLGSSNNGSRWNVDTASGSVARVCHHCRRYLCAWGVIKGPIRQFLSALPQLRDHPLSEDSKASILRELGGASATEQVLSSFRFDREERLVLGSIGTITRTSSMAVYTCR